MCHFVVIYIVSDEQQPKFINEFAEQGLCSANKICIVDHKTIFSGYEAALLTFNTRQLRQCYGISLVFLSILIFK